MKLYIFVIVAAYGLLNASLAKGVVNEDDGFRRLLRRASAEADRPLIREQRRNRDEDDEDGFSDIMENKESSKDLTRNRREEEDTFYHTLLARSESKKKEKRSFDTDDVDNKAGYIIREDWTGDSKISDADRQELENLFQKLNSENIEKNDFVRSTPDEENVADSAAKDYTSWLMEQPVDKMSAALNHKADIDHKLTELFFNSKRASIPKCNLTFPDCKCKRNCHPYQVARYTPCHCSTNNPDRAGNRKNTLSDSIHHIGTKRHNTHDEKAANVKYPEPSHWRKPDKKSMNPSNSTPASSNSTSENCSTAECLCERTCSPKSVASATPCECQEVEAKSSSKTDAKNVITQGSKLCTDDSPKCLCTRACYPKTVNSYSHCNCEGEDTNVKNSTNPVNATISDFVKAAKPAPVVPKQPVLKNNEVLVQPASPASKIVNHTHADQRSVDPVASGWCNKACHPLGVAVENPCKCKEATNPANFFPPKAPEAARVPNPENFFPPKAPEVARVPSQLAASAVVTPGVPAASNIPVAQSVQALPVAVSGDARQQVAPVAQNVATPVAQNVSTPVDQNAVASAAQSEPTEGICKRSCHPYTVLRTNPCKCQKIANKTDQPKVAATDNQPISTSHPSYQGCYKDRKPIRDLPKRFTRFETTPEACISECKYQNYKFAGVQYGYLCFCGNAFGRYGRVKDQDCNSLCNGDSKRHCGAFWHNSVYSVDGKEYDGTDFDFDKVDAAERLRDTLPAPAVKVIRKETPVKNTADVQGANVATHLMKAAQSALNAAKKLLPSVSKKHKLRKKGHKKGRIEKREDDEEDEELQQEKMSAIASIGAAHEILKKTDFGQEKRDAEKEKRSIDEDSDPYDPDNGKDLLAAYLSNVDLYKRQVRSVDDEEEDDDPNVKPKFEYRRMVLGENDDGEFVEKHEDEKVEKKKKKRSTEEKEKRSIQEGSGADEGSGVGKKMGKRSILEGSGSKMNNKLVKKRSIVVNERKRRSLIEGSGNERRIRSSAGSGANEKRKRSITQGSGASIKKKRMTEGSGDKKRRSVMGSGAELKRHSRKRRSLMEGSAANMKAKREIIPDGAVKMAARSSDIKDIDASLRSLESMEKRDKIHEDGVADNDDDDDDTDEGDIAGENESGSGEVDDQETEGESGTISGESDSDDEHDVDRRDSEEDMDSIFVKRSIEDQKAENSTAVANGTENAHLKSDVEKGVDSLLNLVVELYKQQKTIKAFESSVRSLRHDILKVLNVPTAKKSTATKNIRAEIEKTARERLHVLTSSIENKISEFARTHPEASKQANLASTLLPRLPLNDEKLADTKKEITRRAAEFDNLEDAFNEPMQDNDSELPEILKEHFRRNAESEIHESKQKREIINGEQKLSRMHRDIQADEMEVDETDQGFEKLFNM